MSGLSLETRFQLGVCSIRAGSKIWVWRGPSRVRIEAPQAPRVQYMGVGYGEGVSPENFSFLGLKMRILVRSPAHLECLFLQCNASRCRRALRGYSCPLSHPRLTVARSKALECLQKWVLNTIFPGSEYMTNLIIANVEMLSHDDNYSYSFSSDGHQFRGGMAPCPPLWIRHCVALGISVV